MEYITYLFLFFIWLRLTYINEGIKKNFNAIHSLNAKKIKELEL